MAGTVLDLELTINPDSLATEIARKFDTWNGLRSKWIEQKKELVSFVYATDTTTTSASRLPWANSTTTPKLTQIADNLKANYEAALFPQTEWMRWVPRTKQPNIRETAGSIQAYMLNKIENGKFRTEAAKLIDDFILYGNCFATVEWTEESNVRSDGQTTTGFVGPKLKRISPYDIVFNPTASEFRKTPKIIRSIVSLGELQSQGSAAKTLERMLGNRREVAGSTSVDKSQQFVADGFSSIEHYYQSEYVELLTFYGNIYDINTGVLKTNRRIVVADRAYVIEDEEIASWLGEDPIHHAGWRGRPDNLYAMGPLDNLVGMQYRIDHMENLKADAWDQFAYPVQVIRGDVEDYTFQPGTKIFAGEEGSVDFLRPDSTAMQADFQIQNMMNIMEEMAGAPRTAMGIRTPGEKTAFEVQSLQNAAGRIFQHKASKFEIEFIEPVLNTMLEAARWNMMASEDILTNDPDIGGRTFVKVQKDTILSDGSIVPMGARHFAERAIRVQNLNSVVGLMGNPSIAPHLSGKKIAEILAYELGEPDLFGENVALSEGANTQEAGLDLEAGMQERMMVAQEQGL